MTAQVRNTIVSPGAGSSQSTPRRHGYQQPHNIHAKQNRCPHAAFSGLPQSQNWDLGQQKPECARLTL